MSTEAKKEPEERETDPRKMTTEEKLHRTTELILSCAVGAGDAIRTLRQTVRDPKEAYGALHLAMVALKEEFPQHADKFTSLASVLDLTLTNKDDPSCLKIWRQVKLVIEERKNQPMVAMGTQVVDAVLVLPKFKLGHVTITAGVHDAVPPERIGECLNRHGNGDWGPFLNYDEKRRNDENMKKPEGKLYSSYRIDEKKEDSPQNKFYIATEADHSATRIFMPQEN